MMEAMAVARQMAKELREAVDGSALQPGVIASALEELAFACERLEERVEAVERAARNIGSHPALI